MDTARAILDNVEGRETVRQWWRQFEWQWHKCYGSMRTHSACCICIWEDASIHIQWHSIWSEYFSENLYCVCGVPSWIATCSFDNSFGTDDFLVSANCDRFSLACLPVWHAVHIIYVSYTILIFFSILLCFSYFSYFILCIFFWNTSYFDDFRVFSPYFHTFDIYHVFCKFLMQ